MFMSPYRNAVATSYFCGASNLAAPIKVMALKSRGSPDFPTT